MMRRGRLSAATTVEQVVRDAAERRDSGALVVDGGAGSVYLLDGLVYWATTQEEAPFEDALVRDGLLTREQLVHVQREVSTGRDLAFVLASEPGVNERGIVQLVHDRSVAALGKLLRVEAGAFVVDPYAQHPHGVLGQWETGSMLALAVRRYGRPDRPTGVAPSERRVRLVTELADLSQSEITALELRFCGGVRDGRTVAEVAGVTGLSVAAAVGLSERLAERRLVELEDTAVAVDPGSDAPPLFPETERGGERRTSPTVGVGSTHGGDMTQSVIVTLPDEPRVAPAVAGSRTGIAPAMLDIPVLEELPAVAGEGWRPRGFLARYRT